MSNWAPKPLRPTLNEGIFKFETPEARVKYPSPIERQRQLDGSPHTVIAKSALRPPDVKLTLNADDVSSRSTVVKGSMVEEVDQGKPSDSAADPAELITKATGVVSSYLLSKGAKLPVSF